MGQYRQHHTESVPRFDQSFSGACEQQSVETVILQKRFLENKAKKAAKKADKKQPENSSLAGNLQSSVHVVSIVHIYFTIISLDFSLAFQWTEQNKILKLKVLLFMFATKVTNKVQMNYAIMIEPK